jgi:hypothetical protein
MMWRRTSVPLKGLPEKFVRVIEKVGYRIPPDAGAHHVAQGGPINVVKEGHRIPPDTGAHRVAQGHPINVV